MSEDVNEHKRSKDFSDLQNEIAGREVGRISRFLPDQTRNRDARQRRSETSQTIQVMSALERLLREDVEFAALYFETHNKLARYETAADEAAREARDRLAQATSELEAIQVRAGTLPDGTRVYRNAAGDVFTEDGKRVDNADVADVEWGNDPPSWESYQAAKERFDAAEQDLEDIETYQRDVLAPSRDRMEDQDGPVTKEELEDIQKQIEEQATDQVRSMVSNIDVPDVPPDQLHTSGVTFVKLDL